jgi:demethylmenaquinone methyltransferase/2-methoxy-6-polyprenyl-1,4-benzoquinol methylase
MDSGDGDARDFNQVVQDQIAYYRARASEYDEWFYRLGRYDHGPDLNRQWFDEVAVVAHALAGAGQVESALELAAGTGIWTEQLLRLARRVTAIDASREVIDLNRQRVQSPRVTYRQENIFTWEPEPEETYDLVFFSFWLSHVPPEHVAAFLSKVRRCLRPGGQVFIIDSRPEQSGTAKNNPLRADEHIYRTRILNDGSTHTIVKVFYEPDELRQHLKRAGLEADAHITEHYFIYAHAHANIRAKTSQG